MSLITLQKSIGLEDIFNNRVSLSDEWFDYLNYLVREKIIFHNKVLNADYVLKEIRWGEDIIENKVCLKVIVDTIAEESNDIIENIKLRSPLELLPNKPPKEIAGENK